MCNGVLYILLYNLVHNRFCFWFDRGLSKSEFQPNRSHSVRQFWISKVRKLIVSTLFISVVNLSFRHFLHFGRGVSSISVDFAFRQAGFVHFGIFFISVDAAEMHKYRNANSAEMQSLPK